MLNPITKDAISAYRRLIVVALVVFGLDQLSKLWIVKKLPFGAYYAGDSITIIDNFFYLVHIGNKGAAWGILEGQGTLLALIAVAALFAVFYFRDVLELRRPSIQLIFGSIIGGVLGNLLDRIVRGHVVDFFDFHLPFHIPVLLENGRYPAFNIADSGIVIGVFAYLLMSYSKPSAASEKTN